MLCGSLWLLFRCPKCRNILNHHFSKIMLECFWYRVALPRIPIVLRWSERVLQTVATQLSNHRIHSLNVIFMHFFVVELCFRGHFPKFVSLYEIIVIKIGKNLLYLLCSIKAYPVYLYTPSELFFNAKRWYLVSRYRYGNFHAADFYIYFEKYHKSLINRHTWVNIQN